MSWIMLLPAGAVVAAVVALALGLRLVAVEAASLRRSLRLATATRVSIDELERSAERLHAQFDDIGLRPPGGREGSQSPWPRHRPLDR